MWLNVVMYVDRFPFSIIVLNDCCNMVADWIEVEFFVWKHECQINEIGHLLLWMAGYRERYRHPHKAHD